MFIHKLYLQLVKLYNTISQTSWATIGFVLIYSQINEALKTYLIFLLLFSLIVLFITKDVMQTLSLVFLLTVFFPRFKYMLVDVNFLKQSYNCLQENLFVDYFISFSDVLFLLLFSLQFFRRKKNQLLKIKLHHCLMLVIVILGVINSYYALFPIYSMFFLWQFIKGFFIFEVYQDLFKKNKKLMQKVMELILIYLVFNGVLIVLQKIKGGPLGITPEKTFGYTKFGDFTDEIFQIYRPSGMAASPNETATVLGMFTPLFFLLSFAEVKKEKKYLFFFSATLSLLAIFFSMSRMVWLSLLIVGFVVFYRLKKQNIKPTFLPLVKRYKFFLLLVIVFFFIPMVVKRLATLKQTFLLNDGGFSYRIKHLDLSIKYMKNNLLGLGINNFQYKIVQDFPCQDYLGDSTPPHNIFLQIGSSFGVVGLVVWFVFFYSLFRTGGYLLRKDFSQSNKNKKLLIMGAFSSCIIYLLVGQAHPWLIKTPIFESFYLSLAILFSQSNQSKLNK